MTNILNLTRFSSATFEVARNSDWLDTIFFATPGAPSSTVTESASISTSSNNATVSSTSQLYAGMALAQVPGVPAGTYIGAISSSTVFTMVDVNNNPVNATLTLAAAQLTFFPSPLDLTGITFKASLLDSAGVNTRLALSTTAGTLYNGGKSGILGFVVTQALVSPVPAGTYSLDIVAEADGYTLNLFPQGAAVVTVINGVTTP